jgi:group I intron endonuclease
MGKRVYYIEFGIYSIENLINNKRYIGAGKVKDRFNNHRSSLRRNKHKNEILQNEWNQFGENNFIFRILEECQKEELDEKETKYIELYKTQDSNFGYNITAGGPGTTGIFMTEERKKAYRIKRINQSSRYFGVRFKKDGVWWYWQAHTTKEGKFIHISYHKNELDAAKAYNKYILDNNLDYPLNNFE